MGACLYTNECMHARSDTLPSSEPGRVSLEFLQATCFALEAFACGAVYAAACTDAAQVAGTRQVDWCNLQLPAPADLAHQLCCHVPQRCEVLITLMSYLYALAMPRCSPLFVAPRLQLRAASSLCGGHVRLLSPLLRPKLGTTAK